MAKFARAEVVSCAISVNSDASLIAAPKFSTFAAYDFVPELARSSCNFLNAQEKRNLNVVHVLSGASLICHLLHLRG